MPEKMVEIITPKHRGDRIGLHGQMLFLTAPNDSDLQCEIPEGYMQNSLKRKILEAISETRKIIKVFHSLPLLLGSYAALINFTVSSSFGTYILYILNRNAVL